MAGSRIIKQVCRIKSPFVKGDLEWAWGFIQLTRKNDKKSVKYFQNGTRTISVWGQGFQKDLMTYLLFFLI
jgi:hypothetical protein